MTHHARELTFVIDGAEQAGIDKHRPARQGKGVDGRIGHHLKSEGKPALLCFPCADQALADAGHIFCEKRVVDHCELFADLGCVLLPELYVLCLCEQVETRVELGRTLGPDQGDCQNCDHCRRCHPFHASPPAG